MASVQNSEAAKCARRGLPEDEAPEHVASAGELLIKQLATKQTDTNITLEQQLKNEKTFVRGIGLTRDFSSGTSSLQEFEEKQLRAEIMQEFEVHRHWPEASTSPASSQPQTQLKPSHRSDGPLSRTEWEAAASVKPNSLETRLYKFAMQNRTCPVDEPDRLPPGHPAHELADMERELTRTASADPHKLARTVRRKRRQLLDTLAEPSTVHYKPPEPKSSLWDCIEPPVIVPKKPSRPGKVATCRRETLYTIRGGRIVPLDSTKGESEAIESSKERSGGHPFVALETPTLQSRVSGRLTEQEIKQLPRFKNYERGMVSKILYVKNLSSSVTESDLVAVFAKFEAENEEKIIFRMMNGKMRGQAFVTFTSCELATKALEEVNGTILQGKPMVVQYGRHQT